MVLAVFRHKWILFPIAASVVAVLAMAGFFVVRARARRMQRLVVLPGRPEAPPDLEKLRNAFSAGVEAVQRNDGPNAIKHLSLINFGPRAVEEYRLYYLASGYQLAGQRTGARTTLTKLWRRDPKLIYATEAGFDLGNLHTAAGSFNQARETYRQLARKTDSSAQAASARWLELENSFIAGDVASVLESARLIPIRSPLSPQASAAIAVVRSVAGLTTAQAIPLTPAERLERAVSLMRDGAQAAALQELTALEPDAPPSLQLPIQLNRGLTLFQLRRHEEASRQLEPLTATYYRYSVPALYHLAKSYQTVAASIDPTITRTVLEKRQVGSVKVKAGKGTKAGTVTKPRYATVKKTVKLVNTAKKEKKDEYERLTTERLKDLLPLPLAHEVRVEVLSALIAIAESKNQDEYEQELIKQLIGLDPLLDPGLQYFWDKAWAAYVAGDLGTAAPLFLFISETYANANVKRQSEYWYARTIERQGRKEEAAAIYQRLASAPYADLYAIHSMNRGAKRDEPKGNPLRMPRPDWQEIAENEMPAELRLAYELTALSDFRNARVEIQKNMKEQNKKFAEALLADLYHQAGAVVPMYLAVRRAFPELATVEQDNAPQHFIRMYYPIRYEDAIRKYSEKAGVDPYLAMGLILQESYYEPKAKSRVGATGLMQLMQPTAREISARLRVPFGAARLENPEVNIQLGTYYLKTLINTFGGSIPLTVASYNGGQGNVMRWRRAAPTRPLDEFLESIPFPETRNYVKRVTILRSTYSRIAG